MSSWNPFDADARAQSRNEVNSFFEDSWGGFLVIGVLLVVVGFFIWQNI